MTLNPALRELELYRAMSLAEYQHWEERGSIDPSKNWAGHEVGKTGFRAINRIHRWVEAGKGPFGSYDVLVRTMGNYATFEIDTMEHEVFQNRVPVPLEMLVIVLYPRKVLVPIR